MEASGFNCGSGDCSKKIDELIAKWRDIDGGLIPLLQETQEVVGYLPREVLEKIASEMKISLAKVMGIVSFYAQFHVKPRGKNIIRVCMGTACHVRGSAKVMETLEQELGVRAGETTQDLQYTVESIACIGACGLAPVMTVNDETYGMMDGDRVKELLADKAGPGLKH